MPPSPSDSCASLPFPRWVGAARAASARNSGVLHELSITALGVIDNARLRLGPGLTVLTGETGAGKTMVLTGLGLILGGKSTPNAVRTGSAEALAQAVLDVPPGS